MIANSVAYDYASLGGTAASFPTPIQPQPQIGMFDKLNDNCKNWPHRTKYSSSTGHYRRRIGQLYCMTGFLLNIHDNGRVDGNLKDNDPLGVLEFITVAFGLVSIRGKISNNYVCMNNRGKIYASRNQTFECIFKETMLETYYNNYASCAYSNNDRPWYLSISRRGKARRGKKPERQRLPKRTHFLVMLLDDEKLDMNSLRLKKVTRRKNVEPMYKTHNNTLANPIIIRNSRFGVDQATAQWKHFFLNMRSDRTLLKRIKNKRGKKKRRKGKKGRGKGRKRHSAMH